MFSYAFIWQFSEKQITHDLCRNGLVKYHNNIVFSVLCSPTLEEVADVVSGEQTKWYTLLKAVFLYKAVLNLNVKHKDPSS